MEFGCAKDLFAGLHLPDEAASREAGRNLASVLPKNVVLCLQGPMGAGKTTLVKGLAAGFEIPVTVKSPTYNYFSVYRGKERQLIHLDAYRIAGERDFASLLIDEVLETPWNLAVEWPEHVFAWLPRPCWNFRLEDDGRGGRRLHWEGVVA